MKVIQISDETDNILQGIIKRRLENTGIKDTKTRLVAEAIAYLNQKV